MLSIIASRVTSGCATLSSKSFRAQSIALPRRQSCAISFRNARLGLAHDGTATDVALTAVSRRSDGYAADSDSDDRPADQLLHVTTVRMRRDCWSDSKLLNTHHLIEKMAQFNRERVPEGQPHAKGGGAFGHFVVTHDVSAYTKMQHTSNYRAGHTGLTHTNEPPRNPGRFSARRRGESRQARPPSRQYDRRYLHARSRATVCPNSRTASAIARAGRDRRIEAYRHWVGG